MSPASTNRSSPCSGDDVVIVAAFRTPICKSKRGSFKDTHADDLLAPVLKALLDKTKLNPSEVGDIVVGTVLAPGSQRAIECRMAAFYAGVPDTVPLRTVNRQCSSGLQAVADVAASIKAGFYDIGIGAGLESMSINSVSTEGPTNPRAKLFAQAHDCLLPMGITSENVAHRYGVTREEQDQAAVESHRRAAAATSAGKFIEEIIPVATKIVDPKTGEEKQVTVSADDGIRPDTSMPVLAKLKPAFQKNGTTTAGNSSQVSDGAGAVLLMRRDVAMQKGLPILGVFRSFAAVGVDPAVMGIGPAVAIPAAVKAAGLQIDDIDLFEINEAFASQYVYCCKKLELNPEKVNVNGGAIALGHPLGATDSADAHTFTILPTQDYSKQVTDTTTLITQELHVQKRIIEDYVALEFLPYVTSRECDVLPHGILLNNEHIRVCDSRAVTCTIIFSMLYGSLDHYFLLQIGRLCFSQMFKAFMHY